MFTRGPAIYTIGADGHGLRIVADASAAGDWGPYGIGLMTAFDVAPTGNRIVYATCAYLRTGTWSVSDPPEGHDFGYELALGDLEGTSPQRLTANAHFDHYPVWSPDGTRLAFVSSRHLEHATSVRERRLYTMAADGSDVRLVTSIFNAIAHHPPQWSPDGRRLAFVNDDGEIASRYVTYLADADGSRLQRLTPAVSGPSWAPDGTRLAFAKAEETEVGLYTVAADGTDAQRLTTITGWQRQQGIRDPTRAWIETVAWSPAGDQLLYTCGRVVCVVDLDGTPVGKSPFVLEGKSVPAWSLDGTFIAVGSDRPAASGGIELYRMAADGTDVRVLVRARMRESAEDSQLQGVGSIRAACGAGLVIDEPDNNPALVGDCETLLRLRDTIFAQAALNWNPETRIEEWVGVSIEGSPPRVTRLSLGDRFKGQTNLSGTIPLEIGNLTGLQSLNLAHNRFSGPIPAELGGLTQLQRLVLAHNRMSGPIPEELGNLTQLRHLDLSHNQFSASIPVGLGRMTELRMLRLSYNALTGSIPPTLGDLSKLTELDLYKNQLAGAIPRTLGALAWLQTLNLGRNQLTGAVPEELGRLPKLRSLYLSGNPLTGCVPAALEQVRERDFGPSEYPFCDVNQ